MNGYVDAGYIVAIGTLLSYGGSLVARERGARLRLRAGSRQGSLGAATVSRAEPPDDDDLVPPQ